MLAQPKRHPGSVPWAWCLQWVGHALSHMRHADAFVSGRSLAVVRTSASASIGGNGAASAHAQKRTSRLRTASWRRTSRAPISIPAARCTPCSGRASAPVAISREMAAITPPRGPLGSLERGIPSNRSCPKLGRAPAVRKGGQRRVVPRAPADHGREPSVLSKGGQRRT